MEKHPMLFNLKSEDKKLELRLGPPGDYNNNLETNGAKAAVVLIQEKTERNSVSYVRYPLMTQMGPFMGLDSSNLCDSAGVELQCSDHKAVAVSAVPTATASLSANPETLTDNGSHKRTAAAPIVGWPPVRSFRKKFTDNYTSKAGSESPKKIPENVNGKGSEHLFVKINMEGVPIGRKVNLKAYDSYDKLSVAIDELFRGLLAAQGDSCAAASEINADEAKGIVGSGSGKGEYTLVYEDDEGDIILVGDVPWHMFVSTAKRLRVLKSSELSTLRDNKVDREKIPI